MIEVENKGKWKTLNESYNNFCAPQGADNLTTWDISVMRKSIRAPDWKRFKTFKTFCDSSA